MCVFCQIAEGKLPSHKVYEDDKVVAFLDINPVASGHTLVIPKEHYSNLEEIPADDLAYLIKIVKKVGLMLKENLKVEGYNVIENNDPVAGQEVSHLHFHLIPRYAGDNLNFWPRHSYEEEEAKEVLKKILGN